MDLRKKVILGLGWSAGAKFLNQLITWVITIFVMRLLSPGDYGLMAMAGIFISFLTLLNELGLGAALIQKKGIDENTLRKIFGMLLLINFNLFLTLVLIAPLVGCLFNELRVVPVIRLLSIQFILMSLTIIPQSLLAREMNFKKISIIEFISTIVGSLTTLILALNNWGVWSLALGSMSITGARTLGLNIVCPYLRIPIFSFKGIAEFFSFGSYVIFSRILWFFYTQADIFIIGKLLGKELLGFYSIGVQLASLPMEKVSGIINQVAFPAYSIVQSNRQKAGKHFLKSVRIMSLLAFPILWGMSSIAPELVRVLLGDKWMTAIIPFQLLSLVMPIRMISSIVSPATMGLGRPDIDFYNLLFASVVMPTGMIIGYHWGLLGISLTWVILYPIVFLRYLSRVVTILDIKILDVFRAMARPIFSALIMYLIIMGTKIFFSPENKSIGYIVLLIMEGSVIYFGFILRFNRERFQEMLNLMRG